MAFFIGLFFITLFTWLTSKYVFSAGPYVRFWSAGQLAVAIMFFQVGVFHLANPDAFVFMIDGMLPYPRLMIFVSGIAEIVLGLGVVFQSTRKISAWLLILLLLAIFPANLNVAVNNLASPGGLPSEDWYRWSRLAFQPIYIYWVYRSAILQKKKQVTHSQHNASSYVSHLTNE